jgi:hypothetical protein
MVKVRLALLPAVIAVKDAEPLLIVIPVVVQVKVAEPAGELAPPELFKGMLKVAVSPGSSLPLLFPVGSLIAISPKDSAGA